METDRKTEELHWVFSFTRAQWELVNKYGQLQEPVGVITLRFLGSTKLTWDELQQAATQQFGVPLPWNTEQSFMIANHQVVEERENESERQ